MDRFKHMQYIYNYTYNPLPTAEYKLTKFETWQLMFLSKGCHLKTSCGLNG